MPIAPGYVANFETICKAVENGDVALLECTDAKTGVPVVAFCAVSRNGSGYAMTPLAKLFDGNPYEELIPPQI